MKTSKAKSKTNIRKVKNRTRKEKVFSEFDYNSNDGMLTSVWGPSMWHYLHTMSFNYPLHPTCKDKTHYRNFILSLKYVLPCGKCRKNLCKNLEKLPLNKSALKSRETFSRYVYNLHEAINEMKKIKKLVTKTLHNKEAEKGCVEPLYGEKSKCVLRVVPQTEKCESLEIDDKCMKQK